MKESLLGSWQLVSWEMRRADHEQVSHPYGEKPHGLLMYSADGWMSAAIGRAEREPLPEGVSPRQMDAQLLARAFQSFFHYAGRFRVEGDTVVHAVTQALLPNMVGTEQRRLMRFEGADLVLQGEETLPGGQVRTHRLRWRRAGE